MDTINIICIVWVTLGIIAYIITHRNKTERWNVYNWHDMDGKFPIPEKNREIRDNDFARNCVYILMFFTFIFLGPRFFWLMLKDKVFKI